MTTGQLAELMGDFTTDAEAVAMRDILRERKGIDTDLLDAGAESDIDQLLTDEEFFDLIPLAVERARLERVR